MVASSSTTSTRTREPGPAVSAAPHVYGRASANLTNLGTEAIRSFTVFSRGFRPPPLAAPPADHVDSRGFAGWLGTHLKAEPGRRVRRPWQQPRRGGIYDHWGCPIDFLVQAIAAVRALRVSRPAWQAPIHPQTVKIAIHGWSTGTFTQVRTMILPARPGSPRGES
ncbi:DUF6196 family protein [Streptomyces sp. NPDC096132]|uniref:DUF6196 family protein n=1 Tax=Streptomyces sp. NPDC096132 TaxID=3366075 RepID=UPI003826841A